MKWICDGKIAGTFSEERRIEAIRIRPGNLLPANIGIVYECNFEGRGWMSPFKNGQQAGITGERKRLEAIKIRLEGDSKNFSVIYRVNIEGENWTDWSSNGQEAGTTGQSKD